MAPAALDVDFVANPTSGLGLVETNFINTTSGAPVNSWLWVFGDGQTSTQRHPTHTFDNTYGLGNLQPGPQPLIEPSSGGVLYLVAADMDRDGDPDVVSSDIALGQIKWWENIIAPSPWTNLGGGFPGLLGEPVLGAKGTLEGGAPLMLSVAPAPSNTLLLIWLSFGSNPLAAVGGTLHANPPSARFLRSTDAQGEWAQSAPWPLGIPAGVGFWLHGIVQDGSVPAGLTLTNAVTATTP